MITMTIIGNLGADAEVRSANGREFLSFRVAHTEKFTSNGQTTERVIWVDVTREGNGGELLRYLTAGTKVYVTGRPTFRIYDSAKYHTKLIGISIFAQQIELCSQSDQMPRVLFDASGNPIQVVKFYGCPDEMQWGTVVRSKNLVEYEIDNQGLITKRGDEPTTENPK